MKTRYKIIIAGIVLTTIVFGTHQYLMYQCGTLPVFMETPRMPNLWNCLEIWENQSEQQREIELDQSAIARESIPEPEPEPEPSPEPEQIPEEERLHQEKQDQAKIQTQKEIMMDYRGNQHQIDAINKYREEFESGYFLEQFILPNKQNFEKDEVINFVVVQWGYQPQECIFPKVTGYFKPYNNYDYFYAEKISEWEQPEDFCDLTIASDSNGYVVVNMWPMPGIPEEHQTCNNPGEYRILVKNLKDESQVEWGYYTCQRDKLIGEPQPWMGPLE